MKNIEKMNGMLDNNLELQEKLNNEFHRIVETGNAKGPRQVFAEACKNILDIEFTPEEMNTLFKQYEELSPDQLDKVAGGFYWPRAGFGGFIGFAIGAAIGTAVPLPGAQVVTGAVGAAIGTWLGGQE